MKSAKIIYWEDVVTKETTPQDCEVIGQNSKAKENVDDILQKMLGAFCIALFHALMFQGYQFYAIGLLIFGVACFFIKGLTSLEDEDLGEE